MNIKEFKNYFTNKSEILKFLIKKNECCKCIYAFLTL